MAATAEQSSKQLPEHQCPMWAPAGDCSPILLSAHMPGKAADQVLSTEAPATHSGHPDGAVDFSWLQPATVLAIQAICRESQWIEDLSVCLSVTQPFKWVK